ncbi:MAG TPA: tRNA (cytidine(34)-2'-O)-methyltransferase [Chlamydiales bacterium]|nr:tRNA (cytidine(34)-2'-O)-methyltransferase [Chlamydiales bacterium]
MKIVLFQPQIPQNTGNIARTCAATNAGLILVRPLGFSLADRHMKRAGLDYWDRVSLEVVDTVEDILPRGSCFFFSSKAKKIYSSASFPSDSLLIFGSETEGLPKDLFENYPERFYTIPMATGQRCLNLASSVAIVLYEALRQNEFRF